MATDTTAPWAEPVLATIDDLLARDDDGWSYELVEGRLVRMLPTSFEHGELEATLAAELRRFVREHGLGRVSSREPGFHVSRPGEPDTVLAPDVAFVASDRMAGVKEGSASFPHLAPDLVVEIASPSQGRRELSAKAQMWLSVGVRLVWIVWPRTRQVDVWMVGTPGLATTLQETDQLDGGEVLPAFAYPVSELFT
jgi:Uma2 family endonuclease